ncbi:hypothetical protein [Devosia sp. A449]
MTALKSADTRDWVEIRRAYEQSIETLVQICLRFGITKGALEYRCRKERWISRQASLAKRKDSTMARLFAVLEKQVTKLGNASGDTLGDKEAQQLTELIKNFDKMASMAGNEVKAEMVPQKRDMRDLRDKLAKRIDQYKRR